MTEHRCYLVEAPSLVQFLHCPTVTGAVIQVDLLNSAHSVRSVPSPQQLPLAIRSAPIGEDEPALFSISEQPTDFINNWEHSHSLGFGKWD